MTTLAEACSGRPFSNGTEEQAWMGKWCSFCVHDHGMTHEGGGEGCGILLDYIVGDTPDGLWRWPEAWLPEPAGSFSLPSRMVCGQFQPCTEGVCTGDPHADTRAAISAEVTASWAPTADIPGRTTALRTSGRTTDPSE